MKRMSKLVFIYALVFNFSVLINSQRLINICFIAFESSQENINVMFSDRLAFTPNALKLSITTTENEYDSQIDILEEKSIFLKKANRSCDDAFIYHVPHSQRPLRVTQMVFSWGIDEMVIDSMEFVVKQGFLESEHMIGGQMKKLFVNIDLKHQSDLLPNLDSGYKLFSNFKFNNNIRALFPRETYCLSIFSLEYQKNIVLSIFPINYKLIFEFYILVVDIKFQGQHFAESRRYLTKIYPCRDVDIFEDKLKLFVDPSATEIRFKLFDTVHPKMLISVYDVSNADTNLKILDSHFIVVGLEVELKDLTQEMVDRKFGMFLYIWIEEFVRCSVQLPEVVNNLLFSFILQVKVQEVVLETIFQKVDMHTRQLGVYKMKPGTVRELEQCNT